MFVTRRPRGAQPQVKGAQGPAGNTLSRLRPRIDEYAPKSVYMSIPGLKVSGDWEWPTGDVDGRPAAHHLQADSIKLVEAPLDLDIRILMVEFTHTTLFL
jgi:hypothetical protein